MGIVTMGKVTVPARIENLQDLYEAEKGALPAEQVRSVDVSDALVDTVGQKLIGNPDHGGKHMIDMF